MGVNTFLLDRRTAVLWIGTNRQIVGTLRRFFKVTELDADRMSELASAAKSSPSPIAALLMDITEIPMAGRPEQPVETHKVLGWDDGRGSVTDFGWDYLPQLGYAIRDPATSDYTLYEERGNLLYDIDNIRAQELGLVDANGTMIARGQPRITACHSVKPYMAGYVEAFCTFSNGVHDKILVATPRGDLPPESWFFGKRPMDIELYQLN
jgi:hypothetical protein